MRDGAPLHYLDIGRGDPVILLHGFAMRASLWLPFVLRHAHRHRFILPDLRGFGGSHRLPLTQPQLLNQHADDLADLIAGLDLDDIALGGLSMGACTSLQYHRRYGFDRVRAYLHMDQGPCVLNGPDWSHGLLGETQNERLAPWRVLLEELEPFRDRAFRDVPNSLRRRFWVTLSEFYAHAFHARGWHRIAGLARYEGMAKLMAPVDNWTIYLDCMRSYMRDDYDWRPTLHRISVPMTVLVGMDSTMYPAAGQLSIAEHVPHAHMVRFSGCGHAIPFEAPRRFGRALAGFLATDAERALPAVV
jgi:non-heme chloroperoxidase